MSSSHFQKITSMIFAGLVAMSFPAMGAATFLSPTAYLSTADSPFSSLSFQYFHNEDFEDGLVNTPGLSASGGAVVSGSNPNRDSVDADDGSIDGTSTGRSYVQQTSFATLSFSFDEVALGTLPTHVGIVFVDGGIDTTGAAGSFTFEAFDSSAVSLGTITPTLGDGMIMGQTAEDRFIGITNDGGISRVTFRVDSSDSLAYVEADHVQYGAIPEPSSVLFLFLSASSIAMRRRRGTASS